MVRVASPRSRRWTPEAQFEDWCDEVAAIASRVRLCVELFQEAWSAVASTDLKACIIRARGGDHENLISDVGLTLFPDTTCTEATEEKLFGGERQTSVRAAEWHVRAVVSRYVRLAENMAGMCACLMVGHGPFVYVAFPSLLRRIWDFTTAVSGVPSRSLSWLTLWVCSSASASAHQAQARVVPALPVALSSEGTAVVSGTESVRSAVPCGIRPVSALPSGASASSAAKSGTTA